MTTLNQYHQQVNSAYPSRAELRDAERALEAIVKDIDALIDRIKSAADDNGCVYEQLTEAAEQIIAARKDNIDGALQFVDGKLFCGEYAQ